MPTCVYTHDMPLKVPKKLPKPNTNPPKQISTQEQAKLDWVKETKGLLNNIQKDTNIFLGLKIKGPHLLSDKTSGVTKELLSAIEGGFKDLQAQGEIISEVVVMGSSVDYTTFNPKTYAKQVNQATQVHKSLADLKAKAVRIIGK